MTHEELLQKINEMQYDDYKGIGAIPDWPYQVIRAVVELHRPNNEYIDDAIVCNECYRDFYFGGQYFQYGKYPCKTIQAIEKELK